MDETDLLNRIRDKPENFAELFKLYYQPIFGYILRRTGSFDDTADIAADTFLKAFRNIHNFRYTGISVKVWLYRIATNEMNLYFRFRQKHSSIFERLNIQENEIFKNLISDDRKEIESELHKHEQFMSVLKALKNAFTIKRIHFLSGSPKSIRFLGTIWYNVLIIIFSLLILIIYSI